MRIKRRPYMMKRFKSVPRAWLLSGLLLVGFAVLPAHAAPESQKEPLPKSDAEVENQIAAWLQGEEQQRPSFSVNAILSRVAHARAADMARRDYLSAVTPEGNGPNFDVTQAGYRLPTFYDKARTANNIQMYAGAPTAQAAWNVWMKAPNGREHLFGLTKLYARKTQFGVGHAYNANSKYKHYWVLLIAEPALAPRPAPQPNALQTTPVQVNPKTSTDTELENKIATFMKGAGQKRRSLTFNPILARVARERAADMGRRNYFSHVNPDGIGPNYLVTQAGYVLPEYYGKDRAGNSIESIAGGETPQEAWDLWMKSPPHREHILGLSEFYAGQIEYGIGHAYFPNSQYKHYWVILTAEPGKR
jgi:uncharacterized protein YkwD